MKNQKYSLFIVFFIVFPFLSLSAQDTFKKVTERMIDKSKIELATKIASSFFENLKQGKFYDFSEVAIKTFSDGMGAEVQKQTYEQLKIQFGEFKKLDYAETWAANEDDGLQVIRFKGTFENYTAPLEIRVVINDSNKLTGLWFKLWKDNLNN